MCLSDAAASVARLPRVRRGAHSHSRQRRALLLLVAALAVSPAHGGVRSVYSPQLNPAAYSLANVIVEPTISFAWSAASRPFAGSFGALWTATLLPPTGAPASQLTWFRASFGSQDAGALLKLWVDDHFLVHGQSAALNTSIVGYYPLVLAPAGVLLRAEFATLGASASAQVCWSASRDGPWEVLPADRLAPVVAAAEDAYQERRAAEEAGWGTWDARDMLSPVLLPSGLALPLSFYDARARLTTASVQMSCAPSLRPGLHAARGAYTEIERLDLEGGAASVRVEMATTAGGDLVVLVTTVSATRAADVTLSVSPSVMLPYSDCAFSASPAGVNASCAGTPPVSLRPCAAAAAHAAAHAGAPPLSAAAPPLPPLAGGGFSVPLPPPGASVALTSAPGSIMSLAAAVAAVAGQRAQLVALFAAHGSADSMNETFAGLYTAVAWTTVYSSTQGIVNGEFGRSTKLYEWDTLLLAALAAHVDPWAAYSNIIRVTKGATPGGFFPGFIADEFGELDNAKPPVGALALRAVYDAFGESWIVHLTLDKLVRFNAWWARARMVAGLVVPGSYLDPALAPVEQAEHDSRQAAIFETGLDNSPLYDTATYNKSSGLLSQYDVGLHALYIADALTLAGLARDVNRSDLVGDLEARAAAAAERMQSELWCEEAGTYLNKDYVTGAWVPWTAPPTLYPLLTGAPTVAQVERMLTRYYFNASEWCGNTTHCAFGLPSITRANPKYHLQDYWQGRAWGPMNFLVWRGLRAYSTQSQLAARAGHALAVQSRNTFLVEWLARHHVMENYSPVDGTGCSSSGRASPFYHWGSLLVLITMEEAALSGVTSRAAKSST